MPLSTTQVNKANKLADGGGLYLLVNPSGGRHWRLDYRSHGKRKTLALGTSPDVSLKDARERRDEARKLLANDIDLIDLGAQRKAMKNVRPDRAANSFEAIAREWHTKRLPGWSDSYEEHVLWRLERYVFPYLGARPIAEVNAPDLLAVVRRIEDRAFDTAHRALQNCGQVFFLGTR